MEEKALTEKESLELIARMIRNTQNKLQENSGMSLLIWGYATVVTSLLVWFMISQTNDYRWNYLWFLIPLVGGSSLVYLRRRKKPGVRTYIDRILSRIWAVFGVVGFMVSVLSMFFGSLDVLFLILLLMGMGTAISGLVIRFKPLTICGMIGIVCSGACLWLHGLDSILIFALVFTVMQIIPGHILNYYCLKQKQEERVCLKN